MTTIFTLPIPPTLNNLFYNRCGGGRGKSTRYMTWIRAAGWRIKEQRPVAVLGPVSIVLTFQHPGNKKKDLDNLAKAPLDLLVLHRLIDDDSQVQELTLRWADIKDMQVEIYAMAREAA